MRCLLPSHCMQLRIFVLRRWHRELCTSRISPSQLSSRSHYAINAAIDMPAGTIPTRFYTTSQTRQIEIMSSQAYASSQLRSQPNAATTPFQAPKVGNVPKGFSQQSQQPTTETIPAPIVTSADSSNVMASTDAARPVANRTPLPATGNALTRKRSKKENLEKRAKEKAILVKVKKPYTVPSAASGGIPQPSVRYLSQSMYPPVQLSDPRKILVVFDLNGTLLYRPSKKQPHRFVERPHARTFLAYCIKTFVVAIWSSARPDNVQKMLSQLLEPDDRDKVVAVWGRDKLGLSKEDYNERVQCYKRLDKLWNDPMVMQSHPEARNSKTWDQTNTVLVDDSKEKARTQPFNAVPLPEFEGLVNEDALVLPQVHDYLNKCSQQKDVSCFIRANPFEIDPTFTLEPR